MKEGRRTIIWRKKETRQKKYYFQNVDYNRSVMYKTLLSQAWRPVPRLKRSVVEFLPQTSRFGPRPLYMKVVETAVAPEEASPIALRLRPLNTITPMLNTHI